MKISIVLPAKNESGAIGQTIEHIKQLQLAHEIIVVNDGSTDSTKTVAEHAGATVVTHPILKVMALPLKQEHVLQRVTLLFSWMPMDSMTLRIFHV